MNYLVPIGFGLLGATMLVQLTWIIFFCPADKGPPPEWSLYPIPPACLLIFVGGGWMWFH